MSSIDFSRRGCARHFRIHVCRQATWSLALAVFLSWPVPDVWTLRADAQDVPRPLQGYATFEQMQSRLETLAQSPRAKLTSLGQTIGERPIWLLTVAEDPEQSRPAILVMGNVTGPHVLGRELATRMAEHLIEQAESDSEMADWLMQFMVYFIPSPTPDATEENFAFPVRERPGNLTPTDDDRDFEIGEDPPQDLNGDGWITMMRVADDFGTHRTHPQDPRVLIPVDSKKRETGQYRLLPESRDADQDERFGEDGSDGVDFNRNFTFQYDFFGKAAGPHQVSEQETRAVADFLFDHPNIACVFCFSPEDNLFHPWKGTAQSDAGRIKTKVLTDDQPVLEFLAESYRKLHGGKNAPKPPAGQGSFSEWSYFHYGRWTFASPGWWVPQAAKEKPKSTPADTSGQPAENDVNEQPGAKDDAGATEQPPVGSPASPTDELSTAESPAAESPAESPAEESPAEESPAEESPAEESPAEESPAEVPAGQQEGDPSSSVAAAANGQLAKDDKRGAEELNALAWFESQGIDAFVQWRPYEHPDLPDKQVEIGGFKPLYRMNPPEELIQPLVEPHVKFLSELTRNWPRLEVREIKAMQLGPRLYDIRCRVVNVGALPTMPRMGALNRQWYPAQVRLTGTDGARWIEGSMRQSIGRLAERGGSTELRWVFLLPEPEDAGAQSSPQPEFRIQIQSPTLHGVEAVVGVTQP
jgi:hypothetical protein